MSEIAPASINSGPCCAPTESRAINATVHAINLTTHLANPAAHMIDLAMHKIEPAAHMIDLAMHKIEPATHLIEPATHLIEPAAHPSMEGRSKGTIRSGRGDLATWCARSHRRRSIAALAAPLRDH